ncbi:MAG: hypothetical protein P1U78_13920 [Alcanivoracaceae bacterium]|nr:hypothetical protein [Alcanivoracaceae bacterium]
MLELGFHGVFALESIAIKHLKEPQTCSSDSGVAVTKCVCPSGQQPSEDSPPCEPCPSGYVKHRAGNHLCEQELTLNLVSPSPPGTGNTIEVESPIGSMLRLDWHTSVDVYWPQVYAERMIYVMEDHRRMLPGEYWLSMDSNTHLHLVIAHPRQATYVIRIPSSELLSAQLGVALTTDYQLKVHVAQNQRWVTHINFNTGPNKQRPQFAYRFHPDDAWLPVAIPVALNSRLPQTVGWGIATPVSGVVYLLNLTSRKTSTVTPSGIFGLNDDVLVTESAISPALRPGYLP